MPSDHHGFIPSSAEDVLRARVKVELRKRMRALRKALPASACAERSTRIAERLEALEAFAGARSVALFWPIDDRHEVDLRPLDATLRARGVRVAYPGVDPETRRDDVPLRRRPGRDGEHGLRLPRAVAARARGPPGASSTSIVVPALAIDPRGHRIGYGAGYYDRALPRLRAARATIAVAFDFQLVAEVPRHPRVDVPVVRLGRHRQTVESARSPRPREPETASRTARAERGVRGEEPIESGDRRARDRGHRAARCSSSRCGA